MNKLVFLSLACLLLCAPALANPCPSNGGISTYSDLVCQLGPITLDFGTITVSTNLQNPNPEISTAQILYAFSIGLSQVGVLHPGEFFDISIPITYVIPPCCTIEDFSTQIFQLQGCCVDFQFGPTGFFLNATNTGQSDLSWDTALGTAQYTVPEPLSAGLLGVGLGIAAAIRRRVWRGRPRPRLPHRL